MPGCNTREENAADLAAEAARQEREQAIVAMAARKWHREGEIEIDPNATVSEGDDNGAYVQAWVWVEFADTDLDKEE